MVCPVVGGGGLLCNAAQTVVTKTDQERLLSFQNYTDNRGNIEMGRVEGEIGLATAE